MSALFAVTLALSLSVDFVVGHPHISHEFSVISLMSLLGFASIALATGRHYPWWMGSLFVIFFAVWSAVSLTASNHPHLELNVLLYSPIVAVYLGWFYPTWYARLSLSIYLCVISLALIFTLNDGVHEFSSTLALTYALLIAWFALETGMYLRRRAEQESHLDSLTGALNRRGLTAKGRIALARAKRVREPLTIVAIDFDSFKSLNDSGGHAAGDAALSGSASLWRSALGPRDLVARVGGDEFVLLIHANFAESSSLMEAMAAEAPYLWSWGASAIEADTTLQQALVDADSELYRAKARR